MEVRDADLTDERVRALLSFHQQDLLAASPAGQSFALDLSGLMDPAIVVLAAWDDERCVGVGALKRLDDRTGELKSMRTHPDFLRRGIASLMLNALITRARDMQFTRLSLETGRGAKFDPALALYRDAGFQSGDAFGDYQLSDFNQCLHLELR